MNFTILSLIKINFKNQKNVILLSYFSLLNVFGNNLFILSIHTIILKTMPSYIKEHFQNLDTVST